MEPIDPALISQLSRRKLRGSSCDERRDKHNLRRLVLIQNSLVSISPNPSPLRTSPGPDLYEDATLNQHTHNDEPRRSHPVSTSGSIPYDEDDDGFGYIFPDLSLYNENIGDRNDEEEEDDYGHSSTANADAESDWLDAVLSDLDDDDDEHAELVEQHHKLPSSSSPAPPSVAPSSSIPIRMIHTSGYGSTPRYPLPRPQMQLDALPSSISPPSADADVDGDVDESNAALADDGLPPYFDPDDRSSIYSDESSEPSTPTRSDT